MEWAAMENLISLGAFIFHEFLLFSSFRSHQRASICQRWPGFFPGRVGGGCAPILCLKS